MARDFYDKLQIISASLKDNKAIVLLILGMLGSATTNTFQYLIGIEDAFTNKALTSQITAIAKHYTKDDLICKK